MVNYWDLSHLAILNADSLLYRKPFSATLLTIGG